MIKTAVLKPTHTSVSSVHTSTIMFTIMLITCKWHSGIIYSTEMTKPMNQACLSCLCLTLILSQLVNVYQRNSDEVRFRL